MATPAAAEHRDLEARFRKLEAAVKVLAAAIARRPQFEVSAGDLTISGGDLVVDGGDFLLLDTDGSTVFKLGPQEHGDRGVSMYREVGTPVMEVRKESSNLPQRWVMRDGFGNIVVSESAFGVGLSRPRLAHPVIPAATPTYGVYGQEVSSAADTFTTVFRMECRRQNTNWQPRLQVSTSDTTTAAEVRVVNADFASFILNDFFTSADWIGAVAAGSTGFRQLDPTLVLFGNVDEYIRLAVQVRRTAGTGTVKVAIPSSYGA